MSTGTVPYDKKSVLAGCSEKEARKKDIPLGTVTYRTVWYGKVAVPSLLYKIFFQLVLYWIIEARIYVYVHRLESIITVLLLVLLSVFRAFFFGEILSSLK